MITLLYIVGILLAIILLLLLLALLLPKHYSVTVTEVINKPKNEVYHFVSVLQNQTQYSEWLMADPTLQPQIVGIDGTVGSIMKWESHHPEKNKNIGTGEQEILSMDENHIEVALRLIHPIPASCKLLHHIEVLENNQCRYTCTFSAYAKFPINLPSYLFGRKFISKKQQQTLRNVKNIVEQS